MNRLHVAALRAGERADRENGHPYYEQIAQRKWDTWRDFAENRGLCYYCENPDHDIDVPCEQVAT